MKRVLLATVVLAALVVAVVAALLWPEPRFHEARRTAALTAPASADAIGRGQYLATVGDCKACHTRRGGAPYAGGRAIPTPFGTFYAPNITPDVEYGIGQWSEDDFWRALHFGEGRDGEPLYPSFPYTNYTRVTRADSDALFAYLRSLAPSDDPRREHQLRFPYQYRALLRGWRALFFRPGEYEAEPARTATWNRGAYLVQGLGHCSACHEARNRLGAIRSKDNPSGGLVLKWYAPSLHASAEAGLQEWDPGEARTLLTSGRTARAVASGPMAEVVFESLQHLTPADADAMVEYLRSLPDSAGAGGTGLTAPDAQRAKELAERGARLYGDHCADCHGADGRGTERGLALVGNRALAMPSVVNAVRTIQFGGFAPGTAGNPRPLGMPPFFEVLDDADIAAVLTWLRAQQAPPASAVSAAEVARHRGGPEW